MYHSKLGTFWLTTCREVITANATFQKQGTMYWIRCNAVTIGVYSQHSKMVELVSFGLLTWVMPYKYTVHCILKFHWWNWKQYVLSMYSMKAQVHKIQLSFMICVLEFVTNSFLIWIQIQQFWFILCCEQWTCISCASEVSDCLGYVSNAAPILSVSPQPAWVYMFSYCLQQRFSSYVLWQNWCIMAFARCVARLWSPTTQFTR